MPRVYLRTFGCRANQYDSERVRAMLAAAGRELVDDPALADVAIFNSCAVTAEAEADLRQEIRRAARRRPEIRSVVMGCAPALHERRGSPGTLAALPGVSDLVPGADYPRLAAALDLPPESLGAVAGEQSGTRALLRIQDGCDEHCTFCATTVARGASRSRAGDALVEEAARLAERHAEIVLTGIHIGSYGTDVGSSLGALVERLVAHVPAARFRLSSVEATEVDDRLRELLRDAAGRVCPYLHAPLQSGSDGILRRMGRSWYTAGSYAAAVERLVADRPAFGLGADVIAGFPGETEADHQRTLALVERLPFSSLHVFSYSVRPGTAAERLPDRVPPANIARRARELRALAAEKAAAYRGRRIGGPADVVLIGGPERREGLSEDYLSVRATDTTLPRGARFLATLEPGAAGVLIARPSAESRMPRPA